MAKKQQSIAEELGIFEYKNYDSIPAAKLAWVTIKAKQQGKDPKMVKAGIKAKMARKNYKPIKGKITTAKSSKKVGKKKSNMYEASKKQWSPSVGCKFDCVYCEESFKAQLKRQKQRCIKCYNYTPHTHPKRLKVTLPCTYGDEFIFTCASGDVSFCPTPFLNRIIKRIEKQSHKTFVFQTKNPKTFQRATFPDNVILAITLETNRDKSYSKISKAPKPSQRFKDFLKIDHPRKMVTIEPVLDFDLDVMYRWIKQIKPQIVWLGYDSKSKCVFPEPKLEKFMKLHKKLEQVGIKVKLKAVRERR